MTDSQIDLGKEHKSRLARLARALIHQEKAQILIEPQKNASGYWFGGGNLAQQPNGELILVGRYRNHGDSRTGLAAGERGLELAMFTARHFGSVFEKVRAFSKVELCVDDKEVLSIEGSCLYPTVQGPELYLSSEKKITYPRGYEAYQKPGTGVWSIDRLTATSVDRLSADGIEEIVTSADLSTLHVKDPVVFDAPGGGTAMIYCTHPFSWSSSNSSLAVREPGHDGFQHVTDHLLPRGFVWDVAVTRITDRMSVPQLGMFRDVPGISLYFYDGAECIRDHEQSKKGFQRPRGYSCEEISGVAWGFDDRFPKMERLSINEPFFISPQGTGCSRYISTLVTDDSIYATWEQSQSDLSQPLVGYRLPMEAVEALL